MKTQRTKQIQRTWKDIPNPKKENPKKKKDRNKEKYLCWDETRDKEEGAVARRRRRLKTKKEGEEMVMWVW